MDLFRWFRGSKPTEPTPAPTPEKRDLGYHNMPAGILRGWGDTPAAGVAVTTRSALSIPTVYAAVRSVADTLSTLPLPVYQETDAGPVKFRRHPVWRLLNTAPNRTQTARAYRHAMVVDLLSEGEHFSEVQRDGAGNPVGLFRIDPSQVQSKWVQTADGWDFEFSVGNQRLNPDNLLHVIGFTADGYRGESPFRICQDSMSLTLALDRFGSTFVRQGCRPSALLTMPAGLSVEEREEARQAWVEANAGTDKAGKVIALPGEYEIKEMSSDPESSQFHESRVHQMREMQRVTGTPPHVTNDYERQTWNNIQHARMVYVQQSIKPLAVAIEQAINKTLLADAPDLWVEFTLEGILRGSFNEQVDALTKAVGKPFYTQNEARELFNLKPLDGGDELNAPEPAPAPISEPTDPTQEANGNPITAG